MTHKTGADLRSQRLLKLLTALLDCDQAILRKRSKTEMFEQICSSLLKSDRFDAVWISLLQAQDNTLRAQAHAGHDLSYLEFLQLTATQTDAADAADPAHTAVLENRAIWSNDMAADPRLSRLHDSARRHAWHAAAFVPLLRGEAAVGVLSICAKDSQIFDDQTRQLLTQMAGNISHALADFEHEVLRQQTEFALQESEVRYNALFASSCMPMVLVNPLDGRIMDANIRAVNFYGWDQKQFSQMNVADLSIPGDDHIMREMSRILSSGESHFDFRHHLANGDVRDVEVFASPISFSGQTHLMLAVHDVSGRRCAERRVRAAEGLTQRFIDHLPGVAYLKDSQMRLLMANQHLGDLLGVPAVSLLGKTVDQIFPPDVAEVFSHLDRQLMEQGGTLSAEEEFGDRHFEARMFAIDGVAGERGLGGISMDVTERYHVAERTQALLRIHEMGGGKLSEHDFLSQGLEMAEALTHSQIGFLHFVNDDQETLELITWTSGALKGCTAGYDAHYPISQAGIWVDCLREFKPMVFNDYGAYPAKRGLPDGHTKLLRLISVPVIENGKVRMMLGVGNKVTDYDSNDTETVQLIGNDLWRIVRRLRVEVSLKQRVEELVTLNNKLKETQLQLLQSEKMASIGQLAAGVAHEINNPISFVKSNLGSLAQYVEQLLAMTEVFNQVEQQVEPFFSAAFEPVRQFKQTVDLDFLTTDLPTLISETREGVDRVSKIVLDLKNFSRAGDTDFQWTDLQEGLESTIHVVWNELKYKAEVIRDYTVLPAVNCVAAHINQVLMNLLVNAAQSIDEHGRITVRTGVAGEHVWIEVQDTGCGIAADQMTHIFEPFYTTKPIGKGTGLGLSIAFGIVQQHQGRLQVQSQLGQGSTFRMTLPINARALPAVPPNSTNSPS